MPGNAGIWRLEGSPTGTTCGPVTTPPGLTLGIQSLGSLHLGGVSAHLLAIAGWIRVHRETAVAKLSRAFRTDPEPLHSFGF